ncbi:hypothetical protein LIER_22238 [Lithospermum erythrorhizon]|uniref:Helitron helicase-like domain-containing protein n=1 Tax=Lithospermum erythrorhizon TaxID=34254 RepID=A0AAV3QWC2_LITER
MIRTYNNHFAFISIEIHCDETLQKRDHGIYTIKVQGQVHHYLNDLMPNDDSNKLTGIQFYFYDPEHQAMNRLSAVPRLNLSIVEDLFEVMNSNPYSLFLKEASIVDHIDDYHIIIRSDPGLDQRTYTKLTSFEVAGIWTENGNGVSSCNHRELMTNGSGNSGQMSKRQRNTVSCREYYVYKLQQRKNDRSYLLRFGRLLQQYVVDNYIKLESMRLAYYGTSIIKASWIVLFLEFNLPAK